MFGWDRFDAGVGTDGISTESFPLFVIVVGRTGPCVALNVDGVEEPGVCGSVSGVSLQ